MDPKILQASEPKNYKKGDVVLRQEEPADGMYIIDSGSVTVEIDGQHIATLKDGDFFGEMGLMLHKPRNATVKAVSDELKVHFLSKERFEEIKETVGEEVIAKVLERLNENYERGII